MLRTRWRILLLQVEWRSTFAPQGLPHGLRERREHDIEADANSHELALIGIHRVRQPRRENDQHSWADRDHHLIGVVSGQLGDRRPDDRRLRSRIMEIYGIS